jgi:hypothetical protein
MAETDFVLPRSITTPITRFTNFHAEAKVSIRRLPEPTAAPTLCAKMDKQRACAGKLVSIHLATDGKN